MITYSTLAFLGLLAAMVLYRAVAGRVRWRGLLAGHSPGGAGERRLRPARMGLLAAIAVSLLIPLREPAVAAAWPGWLILLAGNLIYLWDEVRSQRMSGPA